MESDFQSDELAFWRAIQASPSDDAPWLVYADWLEERDQTPKAVVIRRSLREIQRYVQAGFELATVMEFVSGIGTSLEMRATEPIVRDETIETEPAHQFGQIGFERVGSTKRVFWIIPASAIVGLISLFASGVFERNEPGRVAAPPVHEHFPPQDAEFVQRMAEILKTTKTLRVGIAWEPEEVAGYSYRRTGVLSLMVFVFARDGTVITLRWETLGVGFPYCFVGEWSIGESGNLRVVDCRTNTLHWFWKMNVKDDQYRLIRNSQSEDYVRERLPMTNGTGP